jgi:hypothetical protein
MERTNERMREQLRQLQFEKMPDPEGRPEAIVAPRTVSIFYLGGYDHLTQTTIASILLEALYEHRANLSNRIPPFLALIEEAHTFIPSSREGTADVPSLETLRKLITEGRKFGTGLLLISQRPSRVDETILSQCNSFLILRLVNPRDQSYVKQIMENLSKQDARMLPGFGPGQGIVRGQAVRFPLLVKIKMDEDLVYTDLDDENFLAQARAWRPDKHAPVRERVAGALQQLRKLPDRRPKSGKGRRGMGSAGDPPAPAGDPPTGTARSNILKRPSALARTAAVVPSDESPVLPRVGPPHAPSDRWEKVRKQFASDARALGDLEAATGMEWDRSRRRDKAADYAGMSWENLKAAGLSNARRESLLRLLETAAQSGA